MLPDITMVASGSAWLVVAILGSASEVEATETTVLLI